jgi:hypothetical protein
VLERVAFASFQDSEQVCEKRMLLLLLLLRGRCHVIVVGRIELQVRNLNVSRRRSKDHFESCAYHANFVVIHRSVKAFGQHVKHSETQFDVVLALILVITAFAEMRQGCDATLASLRSIQVWRTRNKQIRVSGPKDTGLTVSWKLMWIAELYLP